jgi:hypothetical protein
LVKVAGKSDDGVAEHPEGSEKKHQADKHVNESVRVFEGGTSLW